MIISKLMIVAFVINDHDHVCWDCYKASGKSISNICTGKCVTGSRSALLCAHCRRFLAYDDHTSNEGSQSGTNSEHSDCLNGFIETSIPNELDIIGPSTPKENDIVKPSTPKDEEPLKTSDLNTTQEPI